MTNGGAQVGLSASEGHLLALYHGSIGETVKANTLTHLVQVHDGIVEFVEFAACLGIHEQHVGIANLGIIARRASGVRQIIHLAVLAVGEHDVLARAVTGAQVDFLRRVLDLLVGGIQDGLRTTQVAGLKLVVEVLGGLVEAPASTAKGRRARTLQNGGEGAAGETLALAIVAHGILGVLNLKHALLAVLASHRPQRGIGGKQTVLVALYHLLAPVAGQRVALLCLGGVALLRQEAGTIQVHLHEHGLCGTLGGATHVVGLGVLAALDEQLLGTLQVGEDELEGLVARGAFLSPLARTIDHIVDERHAAKHAHKAEVIVCAQEIGLAHQSVAQFLGETAACHLVEGHLGHLVKSQVGASHARPLSAIEAQQQLVVGVGLEILHVAALAHVGHRLAALEGVVAHDVANEPLAVVGGVGAKLPHERRVGRVHDLNGSRGGSKISVARCRARGLLGEPVVARRAAHGYGSNYHIFYIFHHNLEFYVFSKKYDTLSCVLID